MSDKEMSDKKVSTKEWPVKNFRAGGVAAAVWKHPGTGKDGQEMAFWSVSLDKRYRDKEGEWKSSRSLNANDIPKAILVLQKAYDYVVCESRDDDNTTF